MRKQGNTHRAIKGNASWKLAFICLCLAFLQAAATPCLSAGDKPLSVTGFIPRGEVRQLVKAVVRFDRPMVALAWERSPRKMRP